MVTCDEIINWYINHQCSIVGGLCELDCHLLERAQKFVADKNNSFLTNLSLTCKGKNVYVKFYSGTQTNRFTFMVCENKIHGLVVRDRQDNGIIMIDCGDRITPQHITEYLTCCPDDCEIDRRLMQEARKYLVEMGPGVDSAPFECYGEHISCRFTGSRFDMYIPTIACVVGNEIIIKGRN